MKKIATLILVIFAHYSFAQQFKAMVFTETHVYHHQSIPAGIKALEKLSAKHHFDLEWQELSHYIFKEEILKDVDLLIFLNTSGDVLDENEQQVFKKFIQSGKGFIGIHCASSTEDDWDWYTQLVGRMFHVHPQIQTGLLKVEDRNFPGMERLPDSWYWTEEWYEFGEEKADDLNYLLTLDESTIETEVDWGTKKGDGMGEFHPIAWYHEYDGGRSFYTSLGHLSSSYEDPLFMAHIYGGIFWAATGKGIKKLK